MREILFRGKDVDRKEWVYGGYSLYPHTRFPCKPTIYEVDAGCWHPVEVIPATVGQYTGMTDKNGKKIFEGDVVHMRTSGLSGHGEIVYKDGSFGIDDKKRKRFYYMYHDAVYRVEGNIHDNPELLEGGAPDGV